MAPFCTTTCLLLSTGFLLAGVGADSMLLNGAQDALFTDASTACSAAFNTSLSCDSSVSLLSYDMDRLNFTQANLTSLCTSSCLSSLLTLETAVAAACTTYEVDFNGATISAVQVVDLFIYKYNMSCLTESSGSFCLVVEETWDVGALNTSGEATWPTYTNKTYPNFDVSPDGTPAVDSDGNIVDNSDRSPVFYSYSLELDLGGQDYYQEGLSLDYEGHGWPTALEYDEYPLEIQCSECFLAQYRQGIESTWGEVYDEVSDQVWNNVKQNCNITWALTPAHNLSTWTTNLGEGSQLIWSYTPTCDQTFTYAPTNAAATVTANDLALANNVPTAALLDLNRDLLGWSSASAGEYCAPEPCQVAVINETIGAFSFVAYYDNITETQFWSWNNYMDPKNLISGEVVCIGPPGGAYVPVPAPTTTASTTTIFPSVPATTGSVVPAPTQTVLGTTDECFSWYITSANDTCDDIENKYDIEFSYFLSLNTYIDDACDNLWADYAYCVAGIAQTTTTTTSTGAPATISAIATATTATATTTSTFVTAPTQTVTGTTSECYEWYIVASGDSCYDIDKTYGITLAEFQAWNTYVDDACDNIWPDYAYCVNGIAEATAMATAAAVGSTTADVVEANAGI